jgi:putative ABC transport system permease protein
MNMEIRPILSALLRNRAGAILVALQIAITLAIVVNAIYVTQQRLTHIGRPSGMDDQNIFSFWVTSYEKDYDFLGMVNADMALLRQMPGVIDAAPISQMPLSGSGSSTQFYSLPDKKGEKSPANYYLTDNHAVKTLGVTLAAGTEFDANAVEYKATPEQNWAPVAIISSALGKELFKDKPALGQTFYDDQNNPIRVVGVIEHMQGSWVGWDKVDRVMLTPRIQSQPSTQYAIRTAPGELDRVMADVEVALRKRDPNRVIATPMKKMSDMKLQSYAGDSLMAVTLSTVTGLVLIFSSLGIFGLATFNVNTRTKQIGTRRAVGARKRDIVRYFMTENWLVTTMGVMVGCCLALAAGFWLSTQYQLPRLDLYYLIGGVLGLWVVGQMAAWQPSRKAAKVSPAMATRTV